MKKLFFFSAVLITVWSNIAHSQQLIREIDYEVTQDLNVASPDYILLKPGALIRGVNFRAYISDDGNDNEVAYTAPSLANGENYVYTRSFQSAMTNDSGIDSEFDVIESISYVDGLGRSKQQIALKASPDLKDIVTHIAYDDYGRMAKEYLPFEATGTLGALRADAKTLTNTYYTQNYADDLNVNDPNPFSEKEFEASPLNRVLKQAAPGEDWRLSNGHEIRFEYQTNKANEVYHFVVTLNDDYEPTLSRPDTYAAGTLYKNITKDENWVSGKDHSTEEFTDSQGRVVLKRTYNESQQHDTYYAYDDFGNLTYVLSPKMNGSIANIDELGYQYQYDYRNRLIKKKIPGKGWESIVYDKLDQPIMTQDANLKAQNKWLFTRYDVFGRVAYTGIVTGGTRESHQLAADTYANNTNNNLRAKKGSHPIDGQNTGYEDSGYPNSNIQELLTINQYDNYIQSRDGIAVPSTTVLGQVINTNVQSLATITKVKVLDQNQWITTLTAYDKKGRPIYVHNKNPYLGTEDIIKTKLDFVGKVIQTESTHKKSGQSDIVIVDNFEYDHMARLKKQEQQLAASTELIAQNDYDGLGQLIKKNVGNSTAKPLQEVDYKYNIRGWLKSINDINERKDDLFSIEIGYNNGNNPLYNRNISSTKWNTINDIWSSAFNKGYDYNYDALNRIKQADFKHISGVYPGSLNGDYNVSNINYDKNGNIESLNRKGGNTGADWDRLVYHYDAGNQLTYVNDNATGSEKNEGFIDGNTGNDDYVYDDNGNMISDANKGITSIEYNHLNMPTKIIVTDTDSGVLSYIYTANRLKLRKINSNGTITDYAGSFVYENGNLKQITQPEGYIEADDNGWQYIYRYVDIWGNTRIIYSDDNNDGNIAATTEIRKEQNYYPFGLTHKGYNVVSFGVENNLKTYQSQEFTKDLSINVHEWKFRMSDPSIGRFWQVDPLAQDYVYNSIYAFQENKLGMGVELEGAELWEEFVDGMKNLGDGIVDLYNDSTGKELERRIETAKTNNPTEAQQIQDQKLSDRSENMRKSVDGFKQASKATGTGMQKRGKELMYIGTATKSKRITIIGETLNLSGQLINGAVDISNGKDPKEVALQVGGGIVTNIVIGALGNHAKYPNATATDNILMDLVLQVQTDAISKIIEIETEGIFSFEMPVSSTASGGAPLKDKKEK